MNHDDDEPVYYLSEVRQVLQGLMNVYWSAPWWLRWYYKPWENALKTALMQFAGEQIIQEHKESDVLKDWNEQL